MKVPKSPVEVTNISGETQLHYPTCICIYCKPLKPSTIYSDDDLLLLIKEMESGPLLACSPNPKSKRVRMSFSSTEKSKDIPSHFEESTTRAASVFQEISASSIEATKAQQSTTRATSVFQELNQRHHPPIKKLVYTKEDFENSIQWAPVYPRILYFVRLGVVLFIW